MHFFGFYFWKNEKINYEIRPKLMQYLILCMLNMGVPQSTVKIPDSVAMIGPIVDPQALSDLFNNAFCKNKKERDIVLRIFLG